MHSGQCGRYHKSMSPKELRTEDIRIPKHTGNWGWLGHKDVDNQTRGTLKLHSLGQLETEFKFYLILLINILDSFGHLIHMDPVYLYNEYLLDQ